MERGKPRLMKNELTDCDLKAVLKCTLFENCSENDVIDYLNGAGVRLCDFAAGEIISPQLRGSSYGVVLSGSVRIFTNEGGSCVLLNTVNQYEAFDIAALAGENGRVPLSTVKTAGKCRIMFVPALKIDQLMAQYPAVAANCFRFLCGRIGFLNKRIRTLACGTSEQKLADFLLNEFCLDNGKYFVKIKSRSELATRLNLSRASLYRAIDSLEADGIITQDGKSIIISNMERLKNNS